MFHRVDEIRLPEQECLSTGAFARFMSETIMPDKFAGDCSLFLIGPEQQCGWVPHAVVTATTQIGLFGGMVGVPSPLATASQWSLTSPG